MLAAFLQEKEEGIDLEKEIFEVEEPAEPTPTLRQRLVTSITGLKTRLADLFVHFVILPDSKLRLIKYINCLFVFATTLTITYMVRNLQVSKVPFLNRSDQDKGGGVEVLRGTGKKKKQKKLVRWVSQKKYEMLHKLDRKRDAKLEAQTPDHSPPTLPP